MLCGEDLDALTRELEVTPTAITGWRDRFRATIARSWRCDQGWGTVTRAHTRLQSPLARPDYWLDMASVVPAFAHFRPPDARTFVLEL